MLCALLCSASFTQSSDFEVGPWFWCGLVLLAAVCCPIVWMYCNVFGHSPVDGLWRKSRAPATTREYPGGSPLHAR